MDEQIEQALSLGAKLLIQMHADFAASCRHHKIPMPVGAAAMRALIQRNRVLLDEYLANERAAGGDTKVFKMLTGFTDDEMFDEKRRVDEAERRLFGGWRGRG